TVSLQHWGTFENSPVTTGRVSGRFYGQDGLPTPELTRTEAMIARGVQANKQDLEEKQRFPPCNAEWSSARGSRLWCSPKRYVASSWTLGVPLMAQWL
uniref:Uncharacterized protein n=1 Tax=Sus scrofa TaxID=9823 RepID=A0A8D1ZZF9_PIG